MIASRSLKKAMLRVVADSATPLTISELRERLSEIGVESFSEDAVLNLLSDLLVDGELLADTAWHFQRCE